ncbi:TPA: hypothetical protein HA219_02905 [Candidatus Woesearchaeota archaeon]|nr:hypothetical protein [Candidatus Woesearchaeota archaeon]HIH39642.1 hypothetical protein [Candidatus Woesearchaeota archaeon]
MSELKPKRVGVSLGAVSAVFYLACALFIAAAPNFTLSVFNSLFHGIDFTSIAKTSFTLGETIVGLAVIFVTAYIAGALYAWIYNKL